MNKIYKTIWNVSLGSWIAASELTKAHRKTNQINNCSGFILGSMLLFSFNSEIFAADCTSDKQGNWSIIDRSCEIKSQTYEIPPNIITGLTLNNSKVEITGNGNFVMNSKSKKMTLIVIR